MYKVKSPILFLIFNRPKESQILFNAIKEAKPKKLYVAADGPRNNGKDEFLCKETRSILDQVDWDCELITLLRDYNLGCGKAVSNSITWFFENEEEGIVLEDDCLPTLDFFRFSDAMLERYRDDDRIGHICGCNFQDNIKRGKGDYYFSNLTHVWGWASWKRIWKTYDFHMSHLENAIETDFLSGLTSNKHYRKILYNAFNLTQKGKIDTWDYQYLFLNQLNNRLSVIPNYNMISNIGFNADGTHTFITDSPMANVPFSALPSVISHPDSICPNYIADNYFLEKEMPSFFQSKINQLKRDLMDFLVRRKMYSSRK